MLKKIKIARFAFYTLLLAMVGFVSSLYAKNNEFTTLIPSLTVPEKAFADTPYSGDDDCDDDGGGDDCG